MEYFPLNVPLKDARFVIRGIYSDGELIIETPEGRPGPKWSILNLHPETYQAIIQNEKVKNILCKLFE